MLDASPRARTSDPTTSHAAAASVTGITRLQANVLALFQYAGPMTDSDLLDLYGQMVDAGDYPPASPSGVRSRRHELFQSRRLVDTGKRTTNATARRAIVWAAGPGLAPPTSALTLIPRPRAATRTVLEEVLQERIRQDRIHGDQAHLPDGTGGDGWPAEARDARIVTDQAAAEGRLTWLDIAFEEVCEAFTETNREPLRTELIQSAAVMVAWVEALDRR